MNSRFKFLSDVDTSRAQKPIKSRFNKLTLSTRKVAENISVPKPAPLKDKENMARTPIKKTAPETKSASTHEQNAEQKPNVLLNDSSSTMSKDDNSLLTDDETDSAGSSVDTDFINDLMPSNARVRNENRPERVEEIGTQLKNISISSPAELARELLAHKFTQLGIDHDVIGDVDDDRRDDNNSGNLDVVSLSSTNSSIHEREVRASPVQQTVASASPAANVIVLDDSDTESNKDSGDDLNKSPFCPIDNTQMERLNDFFDNVPDQSEDSFIQTNNKNNADDHESIYISETSIEESNSNESHLSEAQSANNANNCDAEMEPNANNAAAVGDNDEFISARSENLQLSRGTDNFADGQIIEMPLSAQTSAGVAGAVAAPDVLAVTDSVADTDAVPLISTGSTELNVRQTTSDVSTVFRSTGRGSPIRISDRDIRITSGVEKVSISAKININIQISGMDSSSSDSSEANSSNYVEEIVESVPAETQDNEEEAGDGNDADSEAVPQSEDDQIDRESSQRANVSTPVRNGANTPAKTPAEASPLVQRPHRPSSAKTPRRTPAKAIEKIRTPLAANADTPRSALQLKQFEFAPPKSMTKTNKVVTPNVTTPTKRQDKSAVNVDAQMTDQIVEEDLPPGFVMDQSIPVPPKDQILLQKLYGNEWKTPEVIRCYSTVKLKRPNLYVEQQSQSVISKRQMDKRISKGFHIFKRNIANDLDSTRMQLPDISMIDPELPPAKPKPATTERINNVPSVAVVRSPYFSKKAEEKKSNMNDDETKSSLTSTDLNDQKTSSFSSSSGPRSTHRRAQKSDKISDTESLTSTDRNEEKTSPKSSSSGPRRTRRRAQKATKITYTESESSAEEEFASSADEWKDENNSDSEDEFQPPARGRRAASKINAKVEKKEKTTAPRRDRKKADKKEEDLVYLDLTTTEVIEVDENHRPANISEDRLAEITSNFLGGGLDDGDGSTKKPKNTRRKLFNPRSYLDDDAQIIVDDERKRSDAKKADPTDGEFQIMVPIPDFLKRTRNATPIKTPTIKDKNDGLLTGSKNKLPASNAFEGIKTPQKRTYGFLNSLDVRVSKNLCHPDALIYRNSFNSNKEKLTKLLHSMFNEKTFDNKLPLPIVWSKKLLTTAGRCRSSTKDGKRICTIELSEKVLTSADRLRCTLMHEMCHAAVWVINGAKESHGPNWKAWASKAVRDFPELPRVEVCHNYEIEYKYTYQCNMCLAKSKSHTKSKKVEHIRCAICHGSISIFLNKKNKDGNIVPTPVRKASGFAIFVKEKYKEFKKPGVSHGDVMKLISKAFSELSVEEKKKY